MKKLMIFLISFALICCSTAMCTAGEKQDTESDRGFSSSWDNQDTYIQPFKKDAYGPGINSDATGRPFEWQTEDGRTDPLLDVKPNAYGPGIGADQYGRPVKPVPFP